MMNLVTSSVEFSFNDQMYRQTNGVAMGSPLGPILANIFVGYHEAHLFSTSSLPLVYKRYVDDTFSIFRCRNDFVTFLNHLNVLHPALKFTYETEEDGKLAFLDVLVHKNTSNFTISVYRKPTFTGSYMRWNSFAPSKGKCNLVKSLTHRAVKICSPNHLQGELSNIKEIFSNNDFPDHVINSCISNKMASMSAESKLGPSKCPIYARLPWKGRVSQQFERQIKSAVSSCFKAAELRIINITKSMFSHTHKDVLPSSTLSNIVYKYTCRCNDIYVGRTTQRLEKRIKQHVPKSLLEIVLTRQNTKSCSQNSLPKSSSSAIG